MTDEAELYVHREIWRLLGILIQRVTSCRSLKQSSGERGSTPSTFMQQLLNATMLWSLNKVIVPSSGEYAFDQVSVPTKLCVLGFRRPAEAGGRRTAAEWVHIRPQDWAAPEGGPCSQAALPRPPLQAQRWQICSGPASPLTLAPPCLCLACSILTQYQVSLQQRCLFVATCTCPQVSMLMSTILSKSMSPHMSPWHFNMVGLAGMHVCKNPENKDCKKRLFKE